jgi:antitoxin VapB
VGDWATDRNAGLVAGWQPASQVTNLPCGHCHILWYIPIVEVPIVEVNMKRTAKLFQNGRSQAIRLPSEFRFEGTEVLVERDPKTGNLILSHKTGCVLAEFRCAQRSN